MKTILKASLIALTLSFSSFAMADDDYDITANANDVLQGQSGSSNYQVTSIAVIADDLSGVGDIDIIANRNTVIQVQGGTNNTQRVNIATVGCDCQ